MNKEMLKDVRFIINGQYWNGKEFIDSDGSYNQAHEGKYNELWFKKQIKQINKNA